AAPTLGFVRRLVERLRDVQRLRLEPFLGLSRSRRDVARHVGRLALAPAFGHPRLARQAVAKLVELLTCLVTQRRVVGRALGAIVACGRCSTLYLNSAANRSCVTEANCGSSTLPCSISARSDPESRISSAKRARS